MQPMHVEQIKIPPSIVPPHYTCMRLLRYGVNFRHPSILSSNRTPLFFSKLLLNTLKMYAKIPFLLDLQAITIFSSPKKIGNTVLRQTAAVATLCFNSHILPIVIWFTYSHTTISSSSTLARLSRPTADHVHTHVYTLPIEDDNYDVCVVDQSCL